MLERDFTGSEEQLKIFSQIRKRSDKELVGNYSRNMGVLREFYCENVVESGGFGLRVRGFLSGKLRKREKFESFDEKSDRFLEFFENNVFSDVVHVSSVELPVDDGGKVTLVAPQTLERAAQSGNNDEIIGNTQYVFGSFSLLRSRGGKGGKTTLRIDEDTAGRAVAVPSDHADLHLYGAAPEELSNRWVDQIFRWEVYRDNMYSLEDFKMFMVGYSACFFTPEEAIRFYDKVQIYPMEAGAWSEKQLERVDESIRDTFRKMRDLLVDNQIIPPIAPELMFHDNVIGTVIDGDELDRKREEILWGE